MISVVDKYFSLNRTLLLVVGLWPYQKSKFAQLQIICIFSILITGVIFQLTAFLTSKCTVDFVIKVLSCAVIFSASVIKYISFYVNSETVKYLMEEVQRIYNDLKDNNEIAIAERYGSNAKFYTASLVIFVISSMSVFIGVQLWPDFTNIVLSGNKSRSRHLQISTEYFIDQERYFYLFLFHINATMCIGSIVLYGTGTILIVYLQYACGMFKIASYRIEKAIQIYIQKNVGLQNEILVYKGIIHAMDIHRKAIKFSNDLISKFQISFMFLIAVGVTSLTLNLFRIALFGYNAEEFLISVVIAFLCILYMFIANLVGQQIIDHNNHVYVTAYKVRWYLTPLHIQKLILFLLQRGSKSFGLNVGGLFVASLECFATLANASLSYFTIMYSMQK